MFSHETITTIKIVNISIISKNFPMPFRNRFLHPFWVPTHLYPLDLLSVTMGSFACSRMLYKYNACSFLVWLSSLKMIILRSIHGMHISRLRSFLLYQYATMCLSIPLLIGIWAVSSFWALYSAMNILYGCYEHSCPGFWMDMWFTSFRSIPGSGMPASKNA